jgi:hypothetical protein
MDMLRGELTIASSHVAVAVANCSCIGSGNSSVVVDDYDIGPSQIIMAF